MVKPKGGRSKTADYVSTHVRIPEPIKDRVEMLKDLYFYGNLEMYDKELAENKRLADEYRNMLTTSRLHNDGSLPDFETALKIAKSIIGLKTSATKSVAKLLTALYGMSVDPSKLR